MQSSTWKEKQGDFIPVTSHKTVVALFSAHSGFGALIPRPRGRLSPPANSFGLGDGVKELNNSGKRRR